MKIVLERIISAASDEGDLILDCFAGSGSTLDVANQLNRNFIGIDNSYEAIKNILKRFTIGLEEMGDYVSNKKIKDQELFVFSPASYYITNNSIITNFSFYCDNRYIDMSNDLLNEYLQF